VQIVGLGEGAQKCGAHIARQVGMDGSARERIAAIESDTTILKAFIS
jgi:hypothetical protein